MGDNATIARRWFSEVWSPDGEALIDDWMAPHAVGDMEGIAVHNREEFKNARRIFLSAFPDLQLIVDDVIEQDGKVAVRWHGQGTHQDELGGIASTNRRIGIRGITWFLFENGKIVRGWDSWNQGKLMADLTTTEAQTTP